MKLRLSLVAAMAASLPILAACGGDKQKTERRGTESTGSKEKAGGGTPAPVKAEGVFPTATATATVKGTCLWDGEVPKQLKIGITGDEFCSNCYKDGNPVSEKIAVDAATKGIPYVFIEVKDADKRWKFETPKDPVKLDQVNCRYEPHVFGMMAGQEIEVTSSDATQHNVHFFGALNRPGKTNFTQNKGQKDMVKLTRPEVAKFKCDIHGWMTSWVHVKKHSLFATSDAKGNFELPKLPAGEDTITAWHENTRWKTEPVTVTVGDGETKEITFKFKK